MPRFFFDFRQGAEICPDAEGTEFAHVEQAYLESFRAAQDMWGELLRQRRDPRRCLFEVRNGKRELLFVLPFMEVIESCTDRQQNPIRFNIEQATHAIAHSKRINEEFVRTLQAVRRTLEASRDLVRVEMGAPIPDDVVA